MIRAHQLLRYGYRDDFRSLHRVDSASIGFLRPSGECRNVSGENLYRGRVFWLYRTQLRGRLGSWGDW